MTTDENAMFQRALGVIEGTLRGLMDQWARQETEATRMRQANNDKLEILTQQVYRLSSDLQGVQQDVAELKNDAEPIIERYKAEENQRVGRRNVWVAIGATLTAIGALAYRAITDFVHGLPR